MVSSTGIRTHFMDYGDKLSPISGRIVASVRLLLLGYVMRKGNKKCVYKTLIKKPSEKRSVGIPRREWYGNIQIGRGK
jgi:hypothetical protein